MQESSTVVASTQDAILRNAPWRERLTVGDVSGAVLRLCGRRSLPVPMLTSLQTLGLQLAPADWEALIRLARRHGMGPLVFAHMAEAGLLSMLPTHIAAEFKEAYCQSLIANRVMQEDLAAVLTAFTARGISAIPIKGILLAERYYGDPALRPASDMDLLVPRADLARAAPILEYLGYAPTSGQATLLDDHALRFRELRFSKVGASPLELHLALSRLPGYHTGFAGPSVWKRAEVVDCRGVPALYLSRGDELRYLCFHFAAQHAGERLIWLVDIAEAVRSWPAGCSWPAFVEETIALGLATPVAVSLALAQDRLDLEFPETLLVQLAEAMTAPRERNAWRLASLPFSNPGRVVRHLLALPSFSERLAFLRGLGVSALHRASGHPQWRRVQCLLTSKV